MAARPLRASKLPRDLLQAELARPGARQLVGRRASQEVLGFAPRPCSLDPVTGCVEPVGSGMGAVGGGRGAVGGGRRPVALSPQKSRVAAGRGLLRAPVVVARRPVGQAIGVGQIGCGAVLGCPGHWSSAVVGTTGRRVSWPTASCSNPLTCGRT